MAELARLFSVFPIAGESADERRLRLQTYWDTLRDFPSWAVEMAGAKVRRGVYPDLNRSFAPTPAEFSHFVRGELASGSKPSVPGEIRYDGERPMVWIPEGDRRWAELCRMEKAENPKAKPCAMTSKYAQGRGRFFAARYVDALRVRREVA